MSGSRGRSGARQRERNNKRREAGERVVDGRGHSGGRFRRERMSPQQEPREAIPAERDGLGRPGAGAGGLAAGGGAHALGADSAVAGEGARGTGEAEQAGVVGALRASRAAAGTVGERLPWGAGALSGLAGAGRRSARDRRGDPGTHGSAGALSGGVGGPGYAWSGFRLGKAHSEAVRGIESKAGEVYRGGMEGAEKRAREAARSDGLLLDVLPSYRDGDWYRLKYSMLEERLEQVREIDGELAYEKMRRAVEKASQEKASQEKAGPGKWRGQGWSGLGKRRQGAKSAVEPERSGPERDFGPSR